MKFLMSFLIVFLCSCSRFADQRVELSDDEVLMAAPSCNCRINAKNAALRDDSIYNLGR